MQPEQTLCLLLENEYKQRLFTWCADGGGLGRSVLSDSFATSWTAAWQAPLFMAFPRQEY